MKRARWGVVVRLDYESASVVRHGRSDYIHTCAKMTLGVLTWLWPGGSLREGRQHLQSNQTGSLDQDDAEKDGNGDNQRHD